MMKPSKALHFDVLRIIKTCKCHQEREHGSFPSLGPQTRAQITSTDTAIVRMRTRTLTWSRTRPFSGSEHVFSGTITNHDHGTFLHHEHGFPDHDDGSQA